MRPLVFRFLDILTGLLLSSSSLTPSLSLSLCYFLTVSYLSRAPAPCCSFEPFLTRLSCLSYRGCARARVRAKIPPLCIPPLLRHIHTRSAVVVPVQQQPPISLPRAHVFSPCVYRYRIHTACERESYTV